VTPYGPTARPRLLPEAAQAIADAVQPGYSVTDVVTRSGGEVSTVYELRGAGTARPLIVKIYAPQWRPKLVKEVYVYRLLARHGIRHIPRVLHAKPFGVPALPYGYTVMTCLDGRPLSEVGDDLTATDRAAVYRQMGQLLAAVNQIAQEQWGYLTTRLVDVKPSNTAYMTEQFDRKLKAFGEFGGDPAMARAIGRQVARHAGAFAGCRRPVLCHNDFHDGNVLVSGATVTGFVDVEGAVAADPMLDLARTDYWALRYDAAKRDAFLRGYGPLPEDWAERVSIYHLHHALERWNWAAATGKPAGRARAESDLETLLVDAHGQR
jgi:aminoglycoside phosphotransferase (APT) family kinase protein